MVSKIPYSTALSPDLTGPGAKPSTLLSLGDLGVLTNPHARRARRGEAPEAARVIALETESEAALDAALARFRASSVGGIVVNGGDGTLSALVTRWFARYGEPPPVLIPVCGGTNNVIAKDVGAVGDLTAVRRRLRAREGATLPTVRRQTMLVKVPGAAPRVGFTFSTGLIVRFIEAYYHGAGRGPAKAAAVVAQKLATVWSPRAREFWRFEPIGVEIDGAPLPLPEGAQLTFLSTIDTQILFFRPFLARADALGGFNVMVNAMRGGAIARHFFALARGRFDGDGHVAREARHFAVRGAERACLDGELFTVRGERLEITPGPPVDFADLRNI